VNFDGGVQDAFGLLVKENAAGERIDKKILRELKASSSDSMRSKMDYQFGPIVRGDFVILQTPKPDAPQAERIDKRPPPLLPVLVTTELEGPGIQWFNPVLPNLSVTTP
jgi:hypothetical protein